MPPPDETELEGLLDIALEWAKAELIAALPAASVQVKEMLAGPASLNNPVNLTSPRIWEGEPPEDLPEGVTYEDFYPCIILTVITTVADIFALINTMPGDHVLGTVRIEVKGVGAGTGFKRLKPLKRFIYGTLEGAEGADVEGGSVGSCSMFMEWPRTPEPTEGGTTYYHSGYQFDVLAQRGAGLEE